MGVSSHLDHERAARKEARDNVAVHVVEGVVVRRENAQNAERLPFHHSNLVERHLDNNWNQRLECKLSFSQEM